MLGSERKVVSKLNSVSLGQKAVTARVYLTFLNNRLERISFRFAATDPSVQFAKDVYRDLLERVSNELGTTPNLRTQNFAIQPDPLIDFQGNTMAIGLPGDGSLVSDPPCEEAPFDWPTLGWVVVSSKRILDIEDVYIFDPAPFSAKGFRAYYGRELWLHDVMGASTKGQEVVKDLEDIHFNYELQRKRMDSSLDLWMSNLYECYDSFLTVLQGIEYFMPGGEQALATKKLLQSYHLAVEESAKEARKTHYVQRGTVQLNENGKRNVAEVLQYMNLQLPVLYDYLDGSSELVLYFPDDPAHGRH